MIRPIINEIIIISFIQFKRRAPAAFETFTLKGFKPEGSRFRMYRVLTDT